MAHPYPCHQGQLHCTAQLKHRTRSPKCCSHQCRCQGAREQRTPPLCPYHLTTDEEQGQLSHTQPTLRSGSEVTHFYYAGDLFYLILQSWKMKLRLSTKDRSSYSDGVHLLHLVCGSQAHSSKNRRECSAALQESSPPVGVFPRCKHIDSM